MRTKDFKTVVKKYKAVFFDAFGVLKNHKGIIPGIDNTFKYLDGKGIDYYVLTNDASRNPEALAGFYQRNSIDCITPEKIISSGMLAMEFLKSKIKTGTVAYLGTKASAHYVESAGLETISIKDLTPEQFEEIKCLVFLDDEGFDWNHDINKVINLIRRKNMTIVVANTDINYPVNRVDIAVAIGGIADMVEEIVHKHFIRFGKPDAQMFMFAYEQAKKKQPFLQRNEILMVGDTLFTDIIGGNKFGMDTALVLSGNTLPEMAEIRIKSSGIIPDHICESVVSGFSD
ncbi:MAG: haloacid dehalogenase [Bacteroidetes bacterium GWF2_42_66]|nr:MAG: haloacid dehalogenase [Bacteroidetes bacterium GWA2_42_15]OFX95997.1 MAG: haloacid dehalogenase [Bacteroidetes bacterium GWE2_42_39]OFY46570.1 MAG: haloacid dehalogenase [Bacteroidetes bacterium GWF2_42_66]HBL75571.1 TIGR01459 family HAD-type hydrolase [Prolixibacteraceae bacterium]HCR91059.1 TIGR01459 family HAD-type hydrolase [Prolixibacteraceae bacterium]